MDRAIAERWADYYCALRRSRGRRSLEPRDISDWLSAFLDVLAAQASELRGRLAEAAGQHHLSRNHVGFLELLRLHGRVTNRLV